MHWLHVIQHWLAVHTGTVNESGPYYGFWSGFGSDIGEVTLIGAVIGLYRAHNCHTHGCWRLARHQVANGQFKVCRVCHRKMFTLDKSDVTLDHIASEHAKTTNG